MKYLATVRTDAGEKKTIDIENVKNEKSAIKVINEQYPNCDILGIYKVEKKEIAE